MKSSTRSRIGVSIIVMAILGFFAAQSHAQSSAPAPLPRVQFFDSSGRPLSSGCIFTYSAGTTNQQATYTDNTGSVSSQNTNPILLDAGGFATIWFSSQAYKIKAVSAGGINCATGTQQWLIDNVPGANQGTASAAFSSLTAASNSNAGTFAANGNTWSFALATALIAPHSGGFAPTASASIGYNDTSNRPNIGVNGANKLLVLPDSTDTLTNKTYDTAGGGNVFKIAGTTIAAVTGSGSAVLGTSPTITTPTVSSPTVSGTVAGGATYSSVVATSPTINSGITNSGSGLQHLRFTSCTGNGSGICAGTGTWNGGGFADGNYTTVCGTGPNSTLGSFPTVQITSQAAGTFGYELFWGNAGQTTPIECIAIHD